MSTCVRVLFDANTGKVYLLELQDAEGTFVNTATVAGEILDEDGNLIWSGSLASLGVGVPITLDDEDGNPVTYTDGNYSATVPAATAFATDAAGNLLDHTLHITATVGSDVSDWTGPLTVRRRGLCD